MKNYDAISYYPEEFINDREVFEDAIKCNGWAFLFAPEKSKND